MMSALDLALAFEWRRKTGGRKASHVFLDGEPVCRGALNSYAQIPTTPLEVVPPEDIGPHGLPYGPICQFCQRAFERGRP